MNNEETSYPVGASQFRTKVVPVKDCLILETALGTSRVFAMITSERGPLPAPLSACILIVYDVPGFNLSIVKNRELGATAKIAVKNKITRINER